MEQQTQLLMHSKELTNNIKGKKNIRFSVVRYGNVFGSRGSVAPTFSKIEKKGTYFITDPDMTRFNITLKESIEMVLWTIKNMEGGEIFVPKIPSYNIMQLVKAFNPNAKIKNIGIRAGEKLHEEMISINEAINTVELNGYYAILNGYSKLKPKYKKIKYVNIFLENSSQYLALTYALKKANVNKI